MNLKCMMMLWCVMMMMMMLLIHAYTCCMYIKHQKPSSSYFMPVCYYWTRMISVSHILFYSCGFLAVVVCVVVVDDVGAVVKVGFTGCLLVKYTQYVQWRLRLHTITRIVSESFCIFPVFLSISSVCPHRRLFVALTIIDTLFCHHWTGQKWMYFHTNSCVWCDVMELLWNKTENKRHNYKKIKQK